MNKKSQPKRWGEEHWFMDFLMTYGWAILVVLVVIGALAYFGVLSPERILLCYDNLESWGCIEYNAEHSKTFDKRLHETQTIYRHCKCYDGEKINDNIVVLDNKYDTIESNDIFLSQECFNKGFHCGKPFKRIIKPKPFCQLCTSFWEECQADKKAKEDFEEECECEEYWIKKASDYQCSCYVEGANESFCGMVTNMCYEEAKKHSKKTDKCLSAREKGKIPSYETGVEFWEDRCKKEGGIFVNESINNIGCMNLTFYCTQNPTDTERCECVEWKFNYEELYTDENCTKAVPKVKDDIEIKTNLTTEYVSINCSNFTIQKNGTYNVTVTINAYDGGLVSKEFMEQHCRENPTNTERCECVEEHIEGTFPTIGCSSIFDCDIVGEDAIIINQTCTKAIPKVKE